MDPEEKARQEAIAKLQEMFSVSPSGYENRPYQLNGTGGGLPIQPQSPRQTNSPRAGATDGDWSLFPYLGKTIGNTFGVIGESLFGPGVPSGPATQMAPGAPGGPWGFVTEDDPLGPAKVIVPEPTRQPAGLDLSQSGLPVSDQRMLEDAANQVQYGEMRVVTLSDGRQIEVTRDSAGNPKLTMVPGSKATSGPLASGGGGGGGGGAAQFDYSKTRDYYEGLWGEAGKARQETAAEAEAQRQFTAGESEKERNRLTVADTKAAELAVKLEELRGNNTLSKADKDYREQELIQKTAKEMADATNTLEKYRADLLYQQNERNNAAILAVKQGDWGIAREQMQSSERIAAATALMDREIAALNAQAQLLAVESQERTKRAQSAASVFGVLAEMAPKDQLRSAFYTMRGLPAPPSATTQLPAGLLSALGVNPDTATAAAQQLRGQTSVPPWMAKLFGGNMAA